MADYAEKIVKATYKLGRRFIEESGVPDVVEEIARLWEEDDIDLLDIMGAGAKAGVQAFTAPLQSLGYLATEANRFSAASALAAMRVGSGEIDKAWEPYYNYATAWTPPQDVVEDDGSVSQAQAVFHAPTLGNLLIIGNDRLVQQSKWAKILVGYAPYTVGTALAPDGPWENGTYVPPAFDIYAPDVGSKINNSDLRYAALLSDLTTEMLLDPLNVGAPIVGTALAATKVSKIAALGGEAATNMDDLVSIANKAKILRRAAQRRPGMGMIDQQGLINRLVNDPEYQKMTQWLAKTSDFNEHRRFWSKFSLGDSTNELAKLSTMLNDTDSINNLINAAAFRNVSSVNYLRSSLDDTTRLNSLDTILGTGDNVLERSLVDFPEGSILPRGHAITTNARKWLDDIFLENPQAKARWEKLAEEDQNRLVTEFGDEALKRQEAWTVFQQVFPDAAKRADALLTAVPTGRKVDDALRYATSTRLRDKFDNWVSTTTVIPGGAHRFRPKYVLTSRPGLVFSVDGIDASQNYDDLIDYFNSNIGTGAWRNVRTNRGRSAGNLLPDGYSFRNDPNVIRMRNAFNDAGTVTTNPSMMRATLVNELQQYALAKLAESSGFVPEIGTQLAKMGMDRARYINAALNSADDGYMTVIMEDGLPLVLQNHPSTVNQVTNFVPIMDFIGVRKAMHAKPLRALINRDMVASVVVDGELLEPNLKGLGARSGFGGVNLKSFGRTEYAVPRLYHSMVDLLDVANNLFKSWVLLRLGYPVRNLTEGALSATASGTGLLKVMANAQLDVVASNTFYNWGFVGKRVLQRQSDKFQTMMGYRRNETALMHALQSGEAALHTNSNQIGQMISTVTDPVVRQSLLNVVTDPNASPEDVARARQSLEYLEQLKMEMALHVGPEVVDAGLAHDINVAQRLYHSDFDGALPLYADEAGHPLEVENGVHALKPGEQLRRPISMTPYSASAQGHLDSRWTYVPRARKYKDQVRAEETWNKKMERLKALRDKNHIQARQGDGQWKRFDPAPGGNLRKFRGDSASTWEFRVIPKGDKKRAYDTSKVIAVDTWGPQVDLRSGGYAKQAIIDKYPDISPTLIDNAVAGKRDAQDALSDALAKHGVYRVVFDDDKKWQGVNVLVHPDGIGQKALNTAVQNNIRRMVEERAKQAGPDMSAVPVPRSKGIGREWNKGRNTDMMNIRPVDPDFPYKLKSVLENGNFREIMQDAIEQQVMLKRRQMGLQTALFQRKDLVRKLSKRRGMPATLTGYRSIYHPNGVYPAADPLSGVDGFKFRQLASGDATVGSTIGFAIHRAELMEDLRVSLLQPTDILPDDPRYWDAMSNLLGRAYRDRVGIEDVLNTTGQLTPDDIDPVVMMALRPGDRQALYEDAVDWALNSAEGRDWVRTMGLTPPTGFTGDVDEAIKQAQTAIKARRPAAERLPSGEPTERAKNMLTPQQHMPYRLAADGYSRDVKVGELIADQFNFVDNFLLDNPEVARLFLQGRATPDNLRAAYEANPWELKPFNGAMSPSSAEYKQILAESEERQKSIANLNARLSRSMSRALQKIGSAPETRVLRHPMFNTIAQSDLQQRITHAERSLGRALTIAERNDLSNRSRAFALREIKRTLYTLEGRSQAEEYLRFVSPFFPAWWNTAGRWGRFYRQNPAMPAKIASRWGTISRSSVIVDENGEPVTGNTVNAAFSTYLLIPFGVGTMPIIGDKINEMFPGADKAMSQTRIPLRSFDVIFQADPTNPGFGPVVAIPMQWVLKRRDEWFQNDLGKFLITKIMPVGPEVTGKPVLDNIYPFLPTGVKRTLDAVLNTNKFSASLNQNVQLLATEKMKGTYDGDANQLYEDAMRLTQMMSGVKVLSAFTSPFATQQQGWPEYIAAQYREIQDKAIAMGHPEWADDLFYEMYPMDLLLTLSSTFNLTGAASTSWVTDNQAKYKNVQRHVYEYFDDPELLWFVDNYKTTDLGEGVVGMSTSDEFNPYSRARQHETSPEGTVEKYRSVKEPASVLREGAIKQGWIMYDKVEAEVEARLIADGLPVNSYEFLKAKRERMRVASDMIATENQIWDQSRGVIDTQKYSKNAEFFRWLIEDEEWIAGKEDHQLPKLIEEYLNARDAAAVEMQQRNAIDSDYGNTSSAKSNEDIAAKLDLKAQTLGADSPSFRLWYNRYFRNDVVSMDE